MGNIKVFIADHHIILRDGLRHILEAAGNIQAVGEAGDGHEALEKIKQGHPDVAIVDIGLPKLNGLEVCRLLRQAGVATRVVIFARHHRERNLYRALEVGARGYVLKTCSAEEIISAVRGVYQGRHFFSAEVSADLVRGYLAGRELTQKSSEYDSLSRREQEVFRLLLQGNSLRDIARILCISSKTVQNHRLSIMKKLQVSDLVGLLKIGARLGMIDLAE